MDTPKARLQIIASVNKIDEDLLGHGIRTRFAIEDYEFHVLSRHFYRFIFCHQRAYPDPCWGYQ